MADIEGLPLRRCAIYARKSVGNRLDLDVNSLETQREVCSAYIKSQRHRGWVELPQRYDDAGHSGSGLERPALARLMHDIEAGEIDFVVIYKVDRLTRSLSDFVRLIEIFDRHGISFVSISQAFDTSDSMGRMILNVLLTFSQFERELIADRIRDSIRTRKQHGLWPSGIPPFGYIKVGGRLKVLEEEAEQVRFIYAEFLRVGTYVGTLRAAREAGVRSTVKYMKSGKSWGGRSPSHGIIYNILRNPAYIGEIPGDGGNYPGAHEPIISRDTWEAAQALIRRRTSKDLLRESSEHLLRGKVWDDYGRPMQLDSQRARRPLDSYRSQNSRWSQRKRVKQYRANAARLDALVIASVADFLDDRRKLRSALRGLGIYGNELDKFTLLGSSAASRLAAAHPETLPELAAALIVRVEVGQEHVSITLRSVELRRLLLWNGSTRFRGRPADWALSDARYELTIAARVISIEWWPALDIGARDPAAPAIIDRKLVTLLKNARLAQRRIEECRERSLGELAQEFGCGPTHFSRLVRLNFLAPDIVTSILDGTQPPTLTRKLLIKATLPLDWALQRRLFGFPPSEKVLEAPWKRAKDIAAATDR